MKKSFLVSIWLEVPGIKVPFSRNKVYHISASKYSILFTGKYSRNIYGIPAGKSSSVNIWLAYPEATFQKEDTDLVTPVTEKDDAKNKCISIDV